MHADDRIKLVLLLLRITVFAVMIVWTLDKFIAPDHAARVIGRFYLLPGLGALTLYAIGAVQLAIVVAFLIGFKKTASTGLVLAMHTVSTLSSFNQYFTVFQGGNLLFWAAWPMLAACFALFYLHDLDTMWSVDKPRS
ncbi:MAG: hypothetical protein RLZ98_2270 [Pseudomonadota bacterium]|jgi:hypothetical protein